MILCIRNTGLLLNASPSLTVNSQFVQKNTCPGFYKNKNSYILYCFHFISTYFVYDVKFILYQRSCFFQYKVQRQIPVVHLC